MRLLYICFLGLIAGIIFLNAACTEQISEKYATITGRVTETDTTIYLSGVTLRDNIDTTITAISDSVGLFRLANISREKHDVTFTKDGYEPNILTFDYIGVLDRPIVTYLVSMRKVGDEPAVEDSLGREGD